MYCPDCDVKTKVLDSRVFDGDVLRKRRCPRCKKIIYTEEFISLDQESVKGIIQKLHGTTSKVKPVKQVPEEFILERFMEVN